MILDAPQGNLLITGAFGSLSDRNAKEGFEPVDTRAVLEKVTALPLARWSYTNSPHVRHLGPMAQDFFAAFDLGPDNRHITTVDAEGVALAAIQGLNQKVEDRDAKLASQESRIEHQAAEITDLKRELSQLKEMMAAVNRRLNRVEE